MKAHGRVGKERAREREGEGGGITDRPRGYNWFVLGYNQPCFTNVSLEGLQRYAASSETFGFSL